MSDKPPEPKPAAPPSTGKTSKAVLALLVLNLGASGFVTFRLVTAAEATPSAAHGAPPAPPPNEVNGPVVAFDPFVVNLDEPGTSRYLKATIQIELGEGDAEHAMEKSKQIVRDAILRYLSGLHVKDTLGSEAKDKIRKDLVAEVEGIVGKDKVHRMFFQEFVVQ